MTIPGKREVELSTLEQSIEEIAGRKAEAVAAEVARQVVAEITSECPVTLARASELTGIPKETLEKWVTERRLKTYPCVGRKRMVKVRDIVWEA